MDSPSQVVPLYLRIGDGPEYRVGHVEMKPRQLPALLRSIAAELERLGSAPAGPAESENPVTNPERRDEQPRPESTTNHQADEPGERAQQHAPRDRQAPPPRRNR